MGTREHGRAKKESGAMAAQSYPTRLPEKPLCIACVVDESYQRFIPLFVLSVFRAYPEYAVRVYFSGRLARRTCGALERIRSEGDFTLVDGYFSHYPKNPQVLKSLRWILYDEAFRGFKYLYLGDVDMFMCREEPGLIEFHAAHCALLGLPYSNAIRPDSRRLSGLHFVEVAPYFDAALKVIKRYSESLRCGELRIRSRGGNEELLYRMMRDSVGLPPESTRTDFARSRPHHGIHLGIWRKRFGSPPPSVWCPKDVHAEYLQQFLEVEADPLGREILRACPLREVRRMRCAYDKFLARP